MSSRSLSIAATGMQAQQENVDRIANNLANVNTTAFKKGRTDFQDLLYQTVKKPGDATSATTENPVGIQFGVGVKNAATSKIFSAGTLKETGRNLDIAVKGEGFFPIQLPNGNVAYTRDGSFRMNSNHTLETSDGFPVIPAVTFPANMVGVTIDHTGQIIVRDDKGSENPIGQIQLSEFANPSGLESVGGNLYQATAASGAPSQGIPGQNNLGFVQQGFLEESNVESVKEMVDLISAQRAFEMNSKVMRTADEMLNNLVNGR